jgi:hypothetical protein
MMLFVMKFIIGSMIITGIILLIVAFQKNESKIKNQTNTNFKAGNKNKKSNILNIIGVIGAGIIVIILLTKISESNPIIGKWRSETNYPFMGKSIDEIEFTDENVYALGMRFKVKYEIDGNRIIVTDEFGIGTIYEVVDRNTIISNVLGFKTVLRRIN